MPLLQLVRARDESYPGVASINHADYVAGPLAVLENQLPLRFSSLSLCLLANAAVAEGFRLVGVELARPGHGQMPEEAGDLETQLVSGIRDSDWRSVQRSLEVIPTDFFVEWVELRDPNTAARVRVSRYGVMNFPVDDRNWRDLAVRVERLISGLQLGQGFVST